MAVTEAGVDDVLPVSRPIPNPPRAPAKMPMMARKRTLSKSWVLRFDRRLMARAPCEDVQAGASLAARSTGKVKLRLNLDNGALPKRGEGRCHEILMRRVYA